MVLGVYLSGSCAGLYCAGAKVLAISEDCHVNPREYYTIAAVVRMETGCNEGKLGVVLKEAPEIHLPKIFRVDDICMKLMEQYAALK